MSSLSNSQVNARSMNGLINVEANSGSFDEIDCNTLNVALSATVPTMALGNNSTHAASTAFVQSAVSGAGAGYVDLTSAQTISGEKTFTSLNTNITGGLIVTYISNTSSIDTPSIGSGLATDNINIVSNQTSGILNLGCRTNRTGAINIGTLVTGNAPINIGSTASTTQTATHNAITSFVKIPSCSVTPTSGSHLTNKTYVDSVSGTALLSSNNTWTGTNNFTVSIPSCSLVPTSGSQLTNKTYVDSVSGTGLLSLNNTWTGTNNFTGSNLTFGAGTSATAVDGLNLQVGSTSSNTLSLSATTIQTINTTNFNIGAAVSFNLIPAGTIIQGLYTSAPTGYVLCDGTSYATVTLSKLFAVISYNYGGSGANFNVPDFRGAVLKGTGSQTVGGVTYTGGALSSAGRQQDAVLTPLYASNEGFRSCAAGARDCVSRDIITSDPTDTNTGILPRFDRTATDNRVFNYSVNFYIKY